ncbi:hypothetical protein EJ08DRAFT_678418 [Tothia fuscella]|uniref:Aminoglycoside phosphotransferase domain-containing protein n=1 Tax=Tothia fuscella TaxID=1048955 RepID=A0A9P4NSK8_9PEZI|nr:hypothetical protein EJ08DRAFT_678418 [Tothia fuscella]
MTINNGKTTNYAIPTEHTSAHVEHHKISPHSQSEADDLDAASDSDADDTSSHVSQTSTLRYDHEPYEQIKTKFIALCQELFPGKLENDFIIERMEGGSFNRIVAITVQSSTAKPNKIQALLEKLRRASRRVINRIWPQQNDPKAPVQEEYILRIPRHEDDVDFDDDCAYLRFADGLTQFSVPKIARLDKTADNGLGSPYVLQYRIPGRNLEDLCPELNQGQRLCIARECAAFLTQITKHTYPFGGLIDATSVPEDRYPKDGSRRIVRAKQLAYTAWPEDIKNASFAEEIPPVQYLRARCFSWIAWKKSRGIDDVLPWEILADIVEEVVDPQMATITGIIDWDNLNITSKVDAFKSPAWLWMWDAYMDETSKGLESWSLHHGDCKDPEDEKDLEIKKEYEKNVSAELLRWNSGPEMDIPRWLWTYI